MATIRWVGPAHDVPEFDWYQPGGRRMRRRGPRGLSAGDAEKMLKQLQREAGDLAWDRPRRLRLEEWAREWLATVRLRKKRATYANYRMCLDNHIIPELGRVPLERLRREKLRAFLLGKLEDGYRASTVRLLYTTIQVMLNAAIEEALIRHSPATGLARTLQLGWHDPGAPRALTEGQLVAVLERARESRFAGVYTLLSTTGLRIGEVLGLQWQDVDWDAETARIERTLHEDRAEGTPKSGRARIISLGPEAKKCLRRLQVSCKERALARGRIPSAWVFDNGRGRPIRPQDVRREFKRLLEAAGLPLEHRVHDLRHTWVSLAAAAGATMAFICQQTGWSEKTAARMMRIYNARFQINGRDVLQRIESRQIPRLMGPFEGRPKTGRPAGDGE